MRFVRSAIVFLACYLFIGTCLFAQVDSLAGQDSPTRQPALRPDTSTVSTADTAELLADTTAVSGRPFFESSHLSRDEFRQHLVRSVFQGHPYLGLDAVRIRLRSDKKEFEGKEAMFYSVVGLLLVFAFLRNAFSKYLGDLYSLFFRTTLKQRQVRDQLIQTPLASLLLNIFYFLAGGYYIAILVDSYQLNPLSSFWLLFCYATAALAVIYSVKFMTLKFTGWLFNIRAAMDSYIFIVFLVNKILGIWLVPFIVILAFTSGTFHKVSLTVSWLGIAGFFIYRFILTFGAVRNQIKVNPFHFFIYLLAFEIVPLLLIYKLLLRIF